jgi:hypothetical protein
MDDHVRRLVVIEDGTRTIYRHVEDRPDNRSDLPRPYVISDIMEPTEQVDGRFYTSKKEFRRVGRELGLIEVGNEKLPPKQRGSSDPKFKRLRKQSLKDSLDKYRAGHRARTTNDRHDGCD